MQSVNIQFHMLLEELVEFVADMRSKFKLEIELERFFPKGRHLIPLNAHLASELEHFGDFDRIWLLCKLPKCKKAERFMLNVGRQRGSRLAQAQLGAGTSNKTALTVLKNLSAELESRTSAGIWVIGETGIVGFDKKFRISDGAKKASREGKVVLVSPVFTQEFQVDPPQQIERRTS